MTVKTEAFAGWETFTLNELERNTRFGTNLPQINTSGTKQDSGLVCLFINSTFSVGLGKTISLSEFRVGFNMQHFGTPLFGGTYSGIEHLLYTTGTCDIDIQLFKSDTVTVPEIRIYVNGTLVATIDWVAAGLSTSGAWTHFGVNVVTGVAGRISIYVDGIQKLVYSGNIAGSVDGIWSFSRTGTGPLTSFKTDDWYLQSTPGEPDVKVPLRQWKLTRYTQPGTFAQFSPLSGTNVDNIDDPVSVANDGDLTTNSATAPNLKDSFLPEGTWTDIPGKAPVAIYPYAFAKKGGTEDVKIIIGLMDLGATEYYGNTQDVSNADYLPYWSRFDSAALGSSPNAALINGAQGIYKSAGSFV